MSVLLGALYGQSQFSREIRRVHLVWHTRSASNLRWITSLLEGVAKDITMAYGSDMNPVVVIDVHITGGSEETGLISIPETVAEEYVEITSPPRLRSHFPMGSRFPRQDCRITVRLHRGRADLSEVIHRNRELTRGPLLMSSEFSCCLFSDASLWPCFPDARISSGREKRYDHEGCSGRKVAHCV